MVSPPLPPYAAYPVEIDWYDDGDFTDPIDDVSADVLSKLGGSTYDLTVEYGRDTARSTGPPMIGAASFTLNNQLRGYSPEYGSGPRYQFIKPGRPVRIRALHGTASAYREPTAYREHDPYRGRATYGLMLGNLEAFEQDPALGARVVSVSALSTMKKLLRTVISVPLMAASRTDMAVTAVLDAAGWPAASRSVAISDSLVHQFWVDERPAWDVLVELVATEGPGSLLYQDGDGVLIWKNRNHRLVEPRSVSPQAVLHDGSLAAAGGRYAYTSLRYDPRWVDIVNRATVDVVQRQQAATYEVIWQLGTDFTATATPRVFTARPSDPFNALQVPVAGTDYVVTGGTISVTLAWTTGAVAKLEVAATSGTPTVSGLQLRALPLHVVGETVIEATATVTDESLEKTLKIAAWPELDIAQAQAICDSYLARYRESRPLLEVVLTNADADTLDAMLGVQISDRLTIINAHLGLETDVYVERIRHVASEGGRHVLTLGCEPVASVGSGSALWDAPGTLWDAPGTLWGL